MSIGVVDRKLLWGRSHNRCAYPDCPQPLTVNLLDRESALLGDSGAPLGEEAHIRSGRTDGPRYEADYPADKVDTYSNLILLCPTHHSLIDKNTGAGFSVAEVEMMKSNHELEMIGLESPQEQDQRLLAERTLAAVVAWEEMVGASQWQGLTWALNRPIPSLSEASYDRLLQVGQWLLAKDWAAQFPNVHAALSRFGDVLGLLLEHLNRNFEPLDNGKFRLQQPHKHIPWDPDLYDAALHRFEVTAMATWILAAELTRAANFVIAAARADLDPLYRFESGVLLARDGDGLFEDQIVRVEYEPEATKALPPVGTLAQLEALIESRSAERGVKPSRLNAYSFEFGDWPSA